MANILHQAIDSTSKIDLFNYFGCVVFYLAECLAIGSIMYDFDHGGSSSAVAFLSTTRSTQHIYY